MTWLLWVFDWAGFHEQQELAVSISGLHYEFMRFGCLCISTIMNSVVGRC